MAEIWEIPRMMMREKASLWRRSGQIIVPGATGSGFMPTTDASGGGFWINENDEVNLREPRHVRLWRTIEEYLQGGAQPIVVPMCDRRHYPAPLDDDGNPITGGAGGIPHSDGTLHSDGTGYAQAIVDVELASGGLLRETEITINIRRAGSIRPGMFFSIRHDTWHWRLYRIRSIVEAYTGTGDLMTISFGPGLREDTPGGTRLEFDTPKCLMKLQSEDSMALSIRERRFASPSWRFVEAERPPVNP